jgi:hypothetical protein
MVAMMPAMLAGVVVVGLIQGDPVPLWFIAWGCVCAAGMSTYYAIGVAGRCEVDGDHLRCYAFFRTWKADIHDVESMVIRRRIGTSMKTGVIRLRGHHEIRIIVDKRARFVAFAESVQSRCPWIQLGD